MWGRSQGGLLQDCFGGTQHLLVLSPAWGASRFPGVGGARVCEGLWGLCAPPACAHLAAEALAVLCVAEGLRGAVNG